MASLRLEKALEAGEVNVQKVSTGEVVIRSQIRGGESKAYVLSGNKHINLMKYFTKDEIKRSNLNRLVARHVVRIT